MAEVCLAIDTFSIRVRTSRSRTRTRVDSLLKKGSGENMKRNLLFATLAFVLLFGSASSSAAQVKKVEMHIAGYLCGN